MTETSGTTATPERPRGSHKGGPIARLSLWIRQVIVELRKVVYPTRQQLITYTGVVLVFVAIMIGVVLTFDITLGWAVFELFTS